MKVVLFCGGLGTRLREHSETIPKPLVPIGQRPIIWHLMKYYAHHGHKDFILCLGFNGEMIREYFLKYNAYLTRSFTLGPGGRLSPEVSDIRDWTITFVETGLHSNIGQRLLKVRPYLGQDEMFLANYSDALSDLPLPAYVDAFNRSDAVAGFIAVRPAQSFHVATVGRDNHVEGLHSIRDADIRVNGGFMALRREIFDYLNENEELVEQPFQRLIARRKLFGYRYDGFWASMDTFKDKITFDRMYSSGQTPWMLWNDNGPVGS